MHTLVEGAAAVQAEASSSMPTECTLISWSRGSIIHEGWAERAGAGWHCGATRIACATTSSVEAPSQSHRYSPLPPPVHTA